MTTSRPSSQEVQPVLPDGFELVTGGRITPPEIVEVREERMTRDNLDVWTNCLRQSLYVVGAREQATDRLVGVGMLAGNQRHAELVDGTVHSEFRQRGIGRVLLSERIRFARERKIQYVGLTHDETTPWLKDYYERYGFKPIGFAMWLTDSLEEVEI